MRSRLVIAVVLLCSLALAQTPAAPPAPAPPAADTSKESFVIEQMRNSEKFQDDGTGQRKSYVRVLIQSDAGVQQWGLLSIGYDTAFQRLQIEFVRVRKPDGTVVTASTDAVQDLPSEVQRLAPEYTDYREKHINVPSLRPGDVLEYSVVTDEFAPVVVNQFWSEYSFQRNSVVLDEQFELDVPAGRKLKLKYSSEPRITEAQGRRVYLWTHANAETPEPTMGIPDPVAPDVQMSTFADWDEVARWYASLQSPRAQPDENVRAKAEQLVKGHAAPADKVRAIYDFVSTEVRYLSLSFGVGRYQPHAAADVLRNGYGDCKDKQTLLTALLSSVGLSLRPVLIGSDRKLDPDVPSPAQFDHLIGVIDVNGKPLYLDPTAEVAPAGLLVPTLLKKQALRINGDHGLLVTTPSEGPAPNREKVNVEARLNSEGKLDADVTLTATGTPELVWRSLLRRVPEAQWTYLLKSSFDTLGLKGEVSGVRATAPAALEQAFQITAHLTNDKFATLKRGESFPLPLMNMGVSPAATPDQRQDVIRQGIQEEIHTLHLQLPSNAVISPPPPSIKRDFDFARYTATYGMSAGFVSAERDYQIKMDELPRSRYEDFNQLYTDITNDEGAQLAVRAVTGDVESANATPSKSASDLYESALHKWEAGDMDAARRGFEQLVKVDPKYPQGWLSLGRVYQGLASIKKEYREKAFAAYEHELDNNPDSAPALQALTLSHFQSGDYAEVVKFGKRLEKFVPPQSSLNVMMASVLLKLHRPEEALNELKGMPDFPPGRDLLARAYLQLGRNDDALRLLQHDLDDASDPMQQGRAAMPLAEQGVLLDRAELAINTALHTAYQLLATDSGQDAAAAAARTWKVTNLWDVAGWVYFHEGDMAKAEKYLEAAWQWSQMGYQGYHLGQVYQRLGKNDLAVRTWAEAFGNAQYIDGDMTAALAKAAPANKSVEVLVEEHRLDLQGKRTVEFANSRRLEGSAEVRLVIGNDARIEDVQLADANQPRAAVSAYVPALKGLALPLSFPDQEPIRLTRFATISCTRTMPKCLLVLSPGPQTMTLEKF